MLFIQQVKCFMCTGKFSFYYLSNLVPVSVLKYEMQSRRPKTMPRKTKNLLDLSMAVITFKVRTELPGNDSNMAD